MAQSFSSLNGHVIIAMQEYQHYEQQSIIVLLLL